MENRKKGFWEILKNVSLLRSAVKAIVGGVIGAGVVLAGISTMIDDSIERVIDSRLVAIEESITLLTTSDSLEAVLSISKVHEKTKVDVEDLKQGEITHALRLWRFLPEAFKTSFLEIKIEEILAWAKENPGRV